MEGSSSSIASSGNGEEQPNESEEDTIYSKLQALEQTEREGIIETMLNLDREIVATWRHLRMLVATRSESQAIIEERVRMAKASLEVDTSDDKCTERASALSHLPSAEHESPLPQPFLANLKAAREGLTPVSASPTTLAVRNIPARYTQDSLLEEWPIEATIDFLYLPFSLKAKKTTGMAYINFVSTEEALQFVRRWHGHFLQKRSQRERPLDIVYAAVQGYQANIEIAATRLAKVHNNSILPALFRNGVRLSARAELDAVAASMQASK